MSEENMSQNSNPSGDNQQVEKKGIYKKYLFGLLEIAKIVIIAAIIVLPIRYFLFQPFIVKGESMVPYLQSGDYLIIDEISYRFSEPKRGDIVVLKYPLDERQRFIKRVVGLPGETVNINGGKVTISKNGENVVLDEEYLPANLATDGNINVVLGDEEYFVMGDNRQFSYDSRKWGALPKDYIIGKAFFRVFPLFDMTIIENPSY